MSLSNASENGYIDLDADTAIQPGKKSAFLDSSCLVKAHPNDPMV